jgi:hypothetical protein
MWYKMGVRNTEGSCEEFNFANLGSKISAQLVNSSNTLEAAATGASSVSNQYFKQKKWNNSVCSRDFDFTKNICVPAHLCELYSQFRTAIKAFFFII